MLVVLLLIRELKISDYFVRSVEAYLSLILG